MKKVLLLAALLSFGTVVSFAQTNATKPTQQMPSKEERAKMIAERESQTMQRVYGLTQQQYDEVYKANYEMANQINAFREGNKQPSREDFDKVLNTRDEKLKKIMTAEQYEKYAKTRQRNSPVQQQAPQKK